MNCKLILAVGLGSFVGGVLRYILSWWLTHCCSSSFPLGTLVVNIVGCFLIGLWMGWFQKAPGASVWPLFCITGILGGFTTFSAFSYEWLLLLRSGQIMQSVLYLTATIGIGFLATAIGFKIYS